MIIKSIWWIIIQWSNVSLPFLFLRTKYFSHPGAFSHHFKVPKATFLRFSLCHYPRGSSNRVPSLDIWQCPNLLGLTVISVLFSISTNYLGKSPVHAICLQNNSGWKPFFAISWEPCHDSLISPCCPTF